MSTAISSFQAQELLTVKGLAKILKCSARSVYRMIDAGDVPTPIMVRGMIRFNPEAIQAWIEQGCPKRSDVGTQETSA